MIGPIVQRMANSAGAEDADTTARRCNFCFKRQDQVLKFIVGTNNYICNECVETCTGLVNNDEDKVPGLQQGLHCDFCHKHVREVGTVIAGRVPTSATNAWNFAWRSSPRGHKPTRTDPRHVGHRQHRNPFV